MGKRTRHRENVEHLLRRVLARLECIERKLECVEHKLEHLERKVDNLMALSQDLLDMLAKIDTATTEVGVVIKGLFDQLKNAQITDAEKAGVFAAADAVVAHLTAIAKDPNAPVPPLPEAARGNRRP